MRSVAGRLPVRRAKINLPLLIAGAMFGFLVAGVVVLILVLRDPMPELTQASFDAAWQRWRAAEIKNYDLDLNIGGSLPGRVHLEVRDGKVTAMTRDGQIPRRRHTWEVWTVDGQFDMIERELEMAENPAREMHASAGTQLLLKAQFHPTLGYPERFRRIVLGSGGPEVYWEVVRLAPLAPGK